MNVLSTLRKRAKPIARQKEKPAQTKLRGLSIKNLPWIKLVYLFKLNFVPQLYKFIVVIAQVQNYFGVVKLVGKL